MAILVEEFIHCKLISVSVISFFAVTIILFSGKFIESILKEETFIRSVLSDSFMMPSFLILYDISISYSFRSCGISSSSISFLAFSILLTYITTVTSGITSLQNSRIKLFMISLDNFSTSSLLK